MWLNNHHWHFDYVRLARDTGFTFEKTKSPLDKNKICLIDLVKIIGDGDVGTIEHFMPLIVQYSIDTGEHTGILDQSFLKLFRMSQLAVEYLLFCKKYLDHTVTLLKEEVNILKLENKELKIFNDELKQHTDVLLEKLKSKHNSCSFKCTKCSKAFSTEHYLIAHMERRHFDSNNMGDLGLNIEMEIKEIKQKLNNTEKLMKREELNPKLEDTLNKNYSKVSELLLKFESLKTQVESEFKVLQTQKDFEDKYSKIFQNILDNMKNSVNTELAQSSPYRFCEKRNSVTQTDMNNVQTIEKKIQVDGNFDEIEKRSKPQFDERSFIIEEQMRNNYEIVTNTMGSALKNVELQMRGLWKKLQDLETKNTINHERKADANVGHIEDNEEIKPNSKTTANDNKKPEFIQVQGKIFENVNDVPTLSKNSAESKLGDSERIDTFEEAFLESRSLKITKYANSTYPIEESESEKESPKLKSKPEFLVDVKISPSDITKGKSSSTLGKRSVTSLRRASLSTEVRDKLRKEMEQVLEERFSALGLSLEWKGIPEQTYVRVMDILNHQSILMQKTYSDCKDIRKKLVKVVNEELKTETPLKESEISKKVKKFRMKSASLKSFASACSILSSTKPQSAHQIEIKNRNMFDTDSSSAENLPLNVKRLPEHIIRRSVPYSAVIEELKQSQKLDEKLHKHGDTAEYLREESEQIEKLDLQTKGVLKNFSTSGPVPKKRVLFNLKNNSSDLKEVLKHVGGGSTSSIASSVLDISEDDNSPHRDHDGNSDIKNDIEDLSDSDFSLFNDSNKKNIVT